MFKSESYYDMHYQRKHTENDPSKVTKSRKSAHFEIRKNLENQSAKITHLESQMEEAIEIVKLSQV